MPPVNFVAILIASVIPLVVGFIWYNEKVFGKIWADSIGLTKEDAKKANMGVVFGLSFVMAVFLSFFLTMNVNGAGQEGQFDTFKHGALHGAILGIMVAMPIIITSGLFEMRKWKTMLINVGYWIISMAIMGGILDMMNHFPENFGM